MKLAFRRIVNLFGILVSAIIICLSFSTQMEHVLNLPSVIFCENGDTPDLPEIPSPFTGEYVEAAPVSASDDERLSNDSSRRYVVRLFGVKVRDIRVVSGTQKLYMPGGQAIGVALYTDGILVVGAGEFTSLDGKTYSPASAAGIVAGDVIVSVNGVEVDDSRSFSRLCNDSGGTALLLTILRDGVRREITVIPMLDAADNVYRIGVWSRDSTSGIGTIAFSDLETNRFYALGHSVTDLDTAVDISISGGEAVEAKLTGIMRGRYGQAGELQGTFSSASPKIGTIESNGEFGVVGELYSPIVNKYYPSGLPIANIDEVCCGAAQIISTVDSNGAMVYNCIILKLHNQSFAAQKGIVIEVTDRGLVEKTGGIVQGMSGSPLIQDGKIVGVLTHVFLNDPLRGYCVYARWLAE